jgi:phage shock protein PspC (stress-responsive transcriptional regulator)
MRQPTASERIEMDVNDTQQQGPEESAPEPRKRLVRVREDRMIAGVCAGLGRYFDVDPILFRIGAVALAFVGGAGILLYLAALLLVPSEDAPAPVAGQPGGRNRALVIAGVVVLLLIAWPFLLGGGFLLAGVGIPLALLVGGGVLVWWIVSGEGPSGDARDIARRAALGIAVAIGCLALAVGGAIAAGTGPDWVVPAVVIGCGAAIVAAAFVRPVRWLVLPAVALGLSAGFVSAAGIDLHGGVGDRDYRPATVADLHDRYRLGVGELVVDLSDMKMPRGDVPVKLDLGVGEARLVVPDGVCVATTADVGMGHVDAFNRQDSGVDVNFEDRPRAAPSATRVVLDADVGLGEVRVHDTTAERQFRGDERFHGFDDASASTAPVCG